MTCREATEFLMDYLEGALPEAQKAEFERHLHLCEACVRFLDTYERTARLGSQCCGGQQGAPAAGEPLKAPEGLIKAILAARAKS